MDPMNNPMQNPNVMPGGSVPDANMGMPVGDGQMASGMSGSGIANPADLASPAMGGGMPSVGLPQQPAGMPVQPMAGVQQVATPVMSPGQMFQAGGVGAPMGALGVTPGDFSTANSPLLGATDPITMPAPPKAPDPVEVELNAPFKAAAPVPGSIGSAISMPGDPNQVPNVAFNDPAMMAPNNAAMPNKKSLMSRMGMEGGKKMDKKTMIILGSIAAVIVVAIVAVVVIAL